MASIHPQIKGEKRQAVNIENGTLFLFINTCLWWVPRLRYTSLQLKSEFCRNQGKERIMFNYIVLMVY